jgi:hypothetical protein
MNQPISPGVMDPGANEVGGEVNAAPNVPNRDVATVVRALMDPAAAEDARRICGGVAPTETTPTQ